MNSFTTDYESRSSSSRITQSGKQHQDERICALLRKKTQTIKSTETKCSSFAFDQDLLVYMIT